MYFHIDELRLPGSELAVINGELSGVGCSAYSHIKQAEEEMPTLLPFDINQPKASLHLPLHLFSSVPLSIKPLSVPGPPHIRDA